MIQLGSLKSTQEAKETLFAWLFCALLTRTITWRCTLKHELMNQ